MDNSQNKQSAEAYFNVGTENFPVGQNAKHNNGPNTVDQSQGQVAQRSERDLRSIGSSAMSSPEPFPPEQTTPPGPPLGEVFSAEPPSPVKDQETSHNTAFELDAIRMDGDNLSKGALDFIKGAERELASTGNADEFTRTVDEMRGSLSRSLRGDKVV